MAISLKDWGKQIGQTPIKAAARRGLYSAALRGVQYLVTFIIPSRSPQPVDRGVYKAGWRAVKTANGATIENLEPHAVFIEDGVKNVRLGPAAFAAIAEWAMRKGLANAGNALDVAARIIRAMRARGNIFGSQGMGILRELKDGMLPEFIEQEVQREVVNAFRRRTAANEKSSFSGRAAGAARRASGAVTKAARAASSATKRVVKQAKRVARGKQRQRRRRKR